MKIVLDEGMEIKVCTCDGKVITGVIETVSRNQQIVVVLKEKDNGRKSN